MKRLFATAAIGLSLLLAGCGNEEQTETVQPVRFVNPGEHACYLISGRVFSNNIVITDDGNIWEYEVTSVDGKKIYDSMPVFVSLYNNGTRNDVTDDIILGLTLRGDIDAGS